MQIVVLGVVRPEMAIDFGPKKRNRCLMRGLSMDSPRTVWGLLKQSGDWTEIVHVCCLHNIA